MDDTARTDVVGQAAAWLARFDQAMATCDPPAVSALFRPDGHWRDVLALTWRLETVSGAPAIEALLRETLAVARPHGARLPAGRTPPRRVVRAGTEVIEVIFAFETAYGASSRVARLVPDPSVPEALQAWTLVTTLYALHAAPGNPETPGYTREFGGANWLDRRREASAYADRDPAVVIVGGGQAGLALAARLGQHSVDTLIVDRQARIGDNWRRRYHSLTLHNEVHVNHLPYMPFPPTWPVFILKDKLASWFEAYAESPELNVWTETELTAGHYDNATLARRGPAFAR